MIQRRRFTMPEPTTPPSPGHAANPESVAEFTDVQSVFVRQRNCLLLQADFSPIFVGYYLHLMQQRLKISESSAETLKPLMAFFTLHLVSRPWQESHAWTLHVQHRPQPVNIFLAGSSTAEEVVGRVWPREKDAAEANMLYAQIVAQNKEPQTSVIPLSAAASPAAWVEEFYRQSEQRLARAFDLGGDSYALITAEPGADEEWLRSLTPEQVAELASTEQLKTLETRRFTFRCGCTVERLLPTLRSMRANFEDLLDKQGFIEISCPRCEAQYIITSQMLADAAPAAES